MRQQQAVYENQYIVTNNSYEINLNIQTFENGSYPCCRYADLDTISVFQ